MASAKIAISLDANTLALLDRLVREGRHRSRSAAIQHAVSEHLRREERGRLARECAKLAPEVERRLADEGLRHEVDQWPEY